MIVAGFGFTSSATEKSLEKALAATRHAGGIDGYATAADKAESAVFKTFATGHTTFAIAPDALQSAQTHTQSEASQTARHTGSVAEAAALAAAGDGAVLIVHRQISDDRMATCAIAEGPDT